MNRINSLWGLGMVASVGLTILGDMRGAGLVSLLFGLGFLICTIGFLITTMRRRYRQ